MSGSWRFGEGDKIGCGLVAMRRLGGGSRFEAYLAFDERRLCPVVVKVVRPDSVEDDVAREALAREGRTLAELAHPVIVRLFEARADGEVPGVVLEHIEGPRLSTLLRKYGPLSIEQLAPLGMQLSAALAYLRGLGKVHLDLKPKNIIMAGPPRLIDFSVATTASRAADLVEPTGTRTYMSPEQCDPQRLGPIGPASDIWGLGTVLYEAAAGRPAFSRSDPEAHPQLHRPPAALPADLPGPIARLIDACLRPDPPDRPSANDVARELEAITDALPTRIVLSNLRPGFRRR